MIPATSFVSLFPNGLYHTAILQHSSAHCVFKLDHIPDNVLSDFYYTGYHTARISAQILQISSVFSLPTLISGGAAYQSAAHSIPSGYTGSSFLHRLPVCRNSHNGYLWLRIEGQRCLIPYCNACPQAHITIVVC